MNKQTIIIIALVAATMFQAGFLTKCYWDYKRAPVPVMTKYDMDKYNANPNIITP